jgi:GMP synthase (glutamine-hydrolysing)
MVLRVLFIEFEPDAHPGRLGAGIESFGAAIEIVRVYRKEPLPSLDRFDGLIPLGGSMNAEDDSNHVYLSDVVSLLQEAARHRVPTLGVCLGGQLLARALGARIRRKPAIEIGYFPVELTPAGRTDPLFRGFGQELLTLQWHEDSFDAPNGATLLADSKRDGLQAFRHGSCYGLQFHPEVTPAIVAAWASESDRLASAAEPTSRERLMRDARDLDGRFAAQTAKLCANWMALLEERGLIDQPDARGAPADNHP